MSKVIYVDNNGNETVLKEGCIIPSEVLFRNDCFAIKVWCDEDVANELRSLGYEDDDESVEAVKEFGGRYLESLNDCTDHDWDLIDEAIRAAKNAKALKEL